MRWVDLVIYVLIHESVYEMSMFDSIKFHQRSVWPRALQTPSAKSTPSKSSPVELLFPVILNSLYLVVCSH